MVNTLLWVSLAVSKAAVGLHFATHIVHCSKVTRHRQNVNIVQQVDMRSGHNHGI